MAPTPAEVDNVLRPLTIKDLRVQSRARGLSPAGGVEALRDRLKENMLSTGDIGIKAENGEDIAASESVAGLTSKDQAAGKLQNNYNRPAGQNVGNFLTDRPSSRVLAAPGGASQIVFGESDPIKASAAKTSFNPITGTTGTVGGTGIGSSNNNYSRPAGQNVGNFITDRPSSRVLAAPGGASQIQFG